MKSSSSGKNVRWLRAFLRGKKRLYVRSSIPSHSKRAASALYEIQLQRQECSVASRLPVRQKRLYVRSSIPSHSKRAASALYEIQLQWQECSVASRLPARQKRLYVRSSIPSHSKRAASTLYVTYVFCLVPLRFLLCVVV